MDALKLRDALAEAKRQFHQGQISIDALYCAADCYIDAIKDYRKRTGKKFRIPSRAYLIRAIG